jgi:hypothetical protein
MALAIQPSVMYFCGSTMKRKNAWMCLIAFALAVSACGRTVLNDERTLDVKTDEISMLTVDPAPRDQTIKVEFESAPAAVSVYVLLEKDKEMATQQIRTKAGPPTNVLGFKEKSKQDSFEAVVPANSRAMVFIGRASKDTQVKVKLTN